MKLELEGFEELENKLRGMSKEVGQAADKATKSGAWFMCGRQESNAPRKGITHVEKVSSDNHSATYLIGLLQRFWYFLFFETGVQPHEISGDPLVFQGDSGLVITDKVQHTGMAAQPFIRPSIKRKNREQVTARMGKVFMGVIRRFLE